MINNRMVPDLNTINELIRLNLINRELNTQKKIDFILKKLNEIKEFNIMPNLITFNSCLRLLASLQVNDNGIKMALNILKEMELLNISNYIFSFIYF